MAQQPAERYGRAGQRPDLLRGRGEVDPAVLSRPAAPRERTGLGPNGRAVREHPPVEGVAESVPTPRVSLRRALWRVMGTDVRFRWRKPDGVPGSEPGDRQARKRVPDGDRRGDQRGAGPSRTPATSRGGGRRWPSGPRSCVRWPSCTGTARTNWARSSPGRWARPPWPRPWVSSSSPSNIYQYYADNGSDLLKDEPLDTRLRRARPGCARPRSGPCSASCLGTTRTTRWPGSRPRT